MNSKRKIRLKKRYIIAGIFIIVFMPDLLIKLHNALKAVPVISQIIDMEEQQYAEIEVALILNIVAVIISIMALRVADSSGRIQEEERNGKAVLYARKLQDTMQHNGKVLFQASHYTEEIGKLIVDDSDGESIAFLFSIGKINSRQMDLCWNYRKLIHEIKTLYDNSKETEKHSEITAFCRTYFDSYTDNMMFTREMQELFNALDKAGKGK